ncbi:MlaD family protein [Nocardia huaxiensis]|uniref:MCE family protein n=1 Tax=Nocardia huaxiensis TaxID=2755382 RepID=A0A7D6VD36_9NOCA|nr:MlaD family protein [Nocardia huaxiensis]QLY29515.1 MCE family protein [Nocardia huaxiensis]UFS96927.1 MlaD family protein [Nocardia huaxiensis]
MGIARFQAINGRGPKPWQLLLTGLVGGAVLLVVSMLFATYVKGGFSPKFTINIEAEQVGEGVVEGADVKMDGLRIGSISRIETQGAEKQLLQIKVEPEAAKFLADNMQARFISSNTLGITAVELFYLGPRGNRLSDGATVTLPKDAKTVTVTSVIRMVGDQLAKIDTGPAARIGAVLSFEGSAEGIGKMIGTAIDIGRMKVGDDILVGLDPRPGIQEGARLSEDAKSFARSALEVFRAQSARIAFLTERHDDLEAIVTLIGQVIGDALGIVPQPGFTQFIDAVLSILHPISGAAGGLTSFYTRLPQLLGQVDKAFVTNPDGTVSLQVQLLLAGLPYLAGDPKVVAAGAQTAPPGTPLLSNLPQIPGLTIPSGLFGTQGGQR